MNGFLLLCFVAIASADELGYNYQAIGQDITIGSNGYTIGTANANGIEYGNIIAIDNSAVGIANAFSGGFSGLASVNDANGFVVSSSNGNGADSINNAAINNEQFNTQQLATEFSKEYYTYAASDEDFNDQSDSQEKPASFRKNLRVVFIKTPVHQALSNAALQLAKQASEESTAIYVLSKQTDVGELANRLQMIKSGIANKPQVHFVKYRTPEEALRAQQAIQAQYDALAGATHISNEGVAPVLNFVAPTVATVATSTGISPGGNFGREGTVNGGISIGGSFIVPPQTYLPVVV